MHHIGGALDKRIEAVAKSEAQDHLATHRAFVSCENLEPKIQSRAAGPWGDLPIRASREHTFRHRSSENVCRGLEQLGKRACTRSHMRTQALDTRRPPQRQAP